LILGHFSESSTLQLLHMPSDTRPSYRFQGMAVTPLMPVIELQLAALMENLTSPERRQDVSLCSKYLALLGPREGFLIVEVSIPWCSWAPTLGLQEFNHGTVFLGEADPMFGRVVRPE
jgi:hypothetical protein